MRLRRSIPRNRDSAVRDRMARPNLDTGHEDRRPHPSATLRAAASLARRCCAWRSPRPASWAVCVEVSRLSWSACAALLMVTRSAGRDAFAVLAEPVEAGDEVELCTGAPSGACVVLAAGCAVAFGMAFEIDEMAESIILQTPSLSSLIDLNYRNFSEHSREIVRRWRVDSPARRAYRSAACVFTNSATSPQVANHTPGFNCM